MALQITPEQFTALQEQERERFVKRAADFLRARFPETAGRAEDRQLDVGIRAGIQRAARYGFATEREIVDWLSLMFRLGPRFDEDKRHADLQVPLRGMPGTPSAVRMAFLLNAAAERAS